jgi:hypothetical protein
MSEPSIYIDAHAKSRPIREAVLLMTDAYIDSGASCDQTLVDCREAMKWQAEQLDCLARELADARAKIPKTADGADTINGMQGFVASSTEIIRVVYHAAWFQDNGFTWWPPRLVYSTREAAEAARHA